MRVAPDLSVYLITDESQCRSRGRDVLDTVEAAVDGGVTCVQLRAKGTDGGLFLTQVLEVAEVIGDQVPVIVNDRVDIFLAARDQGAPVAGGRGARGPEGEGRPAPGLRPARPPRSAARHRWWGDALRLPRLPRPM